MSDTGNWKKTCLSASKSTAVLRHCFPRREDGHGKHCFSIDVFGEDRRTEFHRRFGCDRNRQKNRGRRDVRERGIVILAGEEVTYQQTCRK